MVNETSDFEVSAKFRNDDLVRCLPPSFLRESLPIVEYLRCESVKCFASVQTPDV